MLIVEVMSEKKWLADWVEKREIYRELAVKEYFCFDPEAKFLRPALQRFRHESKRLHCKELECYLKAERQMLRLIDAETGQTVMTRQERVEAEKQRADELEREVARLRTTLQGKNGRRSSKP